MATLLVVDDDPEFLVCTAERLRRKNHEVMVAADGRDALDILARQPVDVIVTDVFMPRMDGIELIIEARRRFPGVPVVVISGGYVNLIGPMRNVANGFGAVAFLLKPFTAVELESAIRVALTRAAPSSESQSSEPLPVPAE